MADLATLVIKVDSSQVANAKSTLEALGLSAQEAEQATEKLGTTAKDSLGAVGDIAERVEKRVETMALRMGIHFVLISGIVGSIKSIVEEMGKAEKTRLDNEKAAWEGVTDDIQKAIDKIDEYNGKRVQPKATQRALFDYGNTAYHAKETISGGNSRIGEINDLIAAGPDDVTLQNLSAERQVLQARIQQAQVRLDDANLGAEGLKEEDAKLAKLGKQLDNQKEADAEWQRMEALRDAFFKKQNAAYDKATQSEYELLAIEMKRLGLDATTQGVMQNKADGLGLIELTPGKVNNQSLDPKTIKQSFGAIHDDMSKFYEDGLKLRERNGDLWAGMAMQIEGFSDRASGALADFFNGTKNGWRDMITSMITDMERYIIKKTLMGPLFDSFAFMVQGMGLPTGSDMSGQMGGSSYVPYPTSAGLASIGGDAPAASVVNVTVNHATGDIASNSTGPAVNLSQQINSAVRTVLIQEQRPGGVLSAGGR